MVLNLLNKYNSSVCAIKNPGTFLSRPLRNNKQGHPTTVFCKISVRRSKYCLEISITQEKLKISRWLVIFSKVFRVLLLTSLRLCYEFLWFGFSHFTPQNMAIVRRKRTPKIFGLKIVTERGIGKSYDVVNLQMSSKIFGKIIGKP